MRFLGDPFNLYPNHNTMFVEQCVVQYSQGKGMESQGCNYIKKVIMKYYLPHSYILSSEMCQLENYDNNNKRNI